MAFGIHSLFPVGEIEQRDLSCAVQLSAETIFKLSRMTYLKQILFV